MAVPLLLGTRNSYRTRASVTDLGIPIIRDDR